MIPRMARSFSKSWNPKEVDELTSTTRPKSTLLSIRWGGKVDKYIWEKGGRGHVELL